MNQGLLHELVELTPFPPSTTDIEELLGAFEAMFDSRQRWIEQHPHHAPTSPEERAVLQEVVLREEAWQRALLTAQNSVGSTRSNATRLRAYNR